MEYAWFTSIFCIPAKRAIGTLLLLMKRQMLFWRFNKAITIPPQSFLSQLLLLALFIIFGACNKTKDEPTNNSSPTTLSGELTARQSWEVGITRSLIAKGDSSLYVDIKFQNQYPQLGGIIEFKNNGTFSCSDNDNKTHSGTWKEVNSTTLEFSGLFKDIIPQGREWTVEKLPEITGGYWYSLKVDIAIQDSLAVAQRYFLSLYQN